MPTAYTSTRWSTFSPAAPSGEMYRAVPKIFTREQSLLFRKDHLIATQKFYEKHGGKTIILARFMPFARTFAPVVAGVGRMTYRRFAMFNIIGGVSWVLSMTFLGYFLGKIFDDVVLSAFLSGPGATTMPLVIFSRARLGLNPSVNAVATIIVLVVSTGVVLASLAIARAERRRSQELAAAARGA